jgi:hypothetical protein
LPVNSLAPMLPGWAWFNYWVWSFRGTQSHEKYVYNADGLQLGAIAITGSCAPMDIEGQY